MKVSLITLGCRANQAESQAIKGSLERHGINIVDLKDNPDYCLINTCTVTAKSDYNSRQAIRRAVKSGVRVYVTGCYSKLRPDEVLSISGVEKIIDIDRKLDFIDIVGGQTITPYFGLSDISRPFLKIQDGCNHRCSYCAVRLARGRSISVPPDEVYRRAAEIASGGFRELVLTGIHLGSYGHDLPDKPTLKSVIRGILERISGIRIRLSSLEVNEIDDELIRMMLDGRMCRHFHVPLQSGSDPILKSMKRLYTARYFRRKIELISESLDNVCIGTDVIAGFPGETDGDFDETFRMIEELPFSYIHAFPFSPRQGTEAASMKPHVEHSTASERTRRLLDLGSRKKLDYMRGQTGTDVSIIIEGEPKADCAAGTSGNYLKVLVRDKDLKAGDMIHVRLVDFRGGVLYGMPLGDSNPSK